MRRWIGVGVICMSAVGCAAPSVVPLLTVSRSAMEAEAGRLVDETQRDRAWAQQTRDALAAAFDADLTEQAELDAQWVREAAGAYALAREAVLRYELAVVAERRQRAANLETAARAQQHAIDLIQQRDAIVRKLGGGAWDLFQQETDR